MSADFSSINEASNMVWPLFSAVAFGAAFVISGVLTPMAARLGAKLGMMDLPGEERRVHTAPTPRSGGIAVAAAFFGVFGGGLFVGPWLIQNTSLLPPELAERANAYLANIPDLIGPLAAILGGGFVLFFTGVIDDKRPLPPLIKLTVQLAAAAGLWLAGVQANAFLPAPLGFALTIGWVVVLTNAFNFLDNMNGLSSGVAMVAALGFLWHAWVGGEWFMMAAWAALAGSVGGFWIWNFTRGRPFLGDGGSLLIGFLMAAFALRATYFQPGVPTGLPVLTPAILLALPLFDTASVMWIRLKERRPFMVGDRSHLSHRLTDLGFSRPGAVVFHYVIGAILFLLSVALRYLPEGPALGLLGAVVLLFVLLFMLERAAAARISIEDRDARFVRNGVEN